MTTSDRTRADTTEALRFRPASVADGAALWRLVKATGGLEPNTPYCYLLLASDFADTCLVAEAAGVIVGTVLGYRPPREPDAAFVWQVGVLPSHRGLGLASRMLAAWVDLPANQGCRWVTATVADDNPASQALFRGFARTLGTACAVEPRFTAELFPQPHPPEPLFRIGPLLRTSAAQAD